MWDADSMLKGLELLFTSQNLLWLIVGFSSGIVVGAIPGLVESTYLAILLPYTIYMDVWSAMLFMTGVYVSCEAAGSYPAILMNMPGTPGASATTFEGYALTKKGFPGQAIGVSVTASVIGTFLGALMFMFLGPVFATFALNFGSPEMFMLAVFGMTAVASLTGKSVLKGLISATLGLLIATTRLDLFNALPRAHFGILEVYDSIPLLPALLGLFGFCEILILANRQFIVSKETATYKGLKAPLEGVMIALRYPFVILRSAIIGIIIGIIPGAGSTPANIVSYGQAKQWSQEPEKFGTGTYEGLVATDVSNNAVIGGTLVPTLTLGIPGSGTTMIFLAALMLQGIRPGPGFYDQFAVQAYTIGWALMLCSVLVMIICLPLAGNFARVVFIPTRFLIPFISVALLVGVFSARQYLIDIGIMVVFGLLGFVVRKYGYSPVALLLALILGPLLEENFFRCLVIGGPILFVTKPIALTLFLLSILSLMLPFLLQWTARRRENRESVSLIEE
jgi:putative tricarboxylic transport membrane protein